MFTELARLDNGLFNDFQRLQRDVDSLFGGGLWRNNIRAAAPGSFPALNVATSDDAVTVYLFAPGIDTDKLDVTLQRNVLTISGERAVGEEKSEGYHARERFVGKFRRAVTLNEDVDGDKVEASYKDGILTVRIGKREAVKPRQITVNAA